MRGGMRGAWLTGLLIFSLVSGGFILVQGHPASEQELGALLADEAREGAREVADDLGLPDMTEPPRGTGTFYRYTDASGTMRFVGSLDEVPPAFLASAREVANDRVQRATSEPGTRPARAPERAVAARQPDVVVYTTSWCGWCRKTLKFLDERGVAFENRDIEADETWRDELRDKTGSTSIPVVEIDGEIIRGYDPARMDELL